MKKLILLMLVFLVFLYSVEAGSVSGRVLDQNGQSLPGANIVAKKDGRIINGATSDPDGNFAIGGITGRFRVTASYIGYAEQTKTMNEGQSNTFRLREISFGLSPIVVTADRDPIVPFDIEPRWSDANLITPFMRFTIIGDVQSDNVQLQSDGLDVAPRGSELHEEEGFLEECGDKGGCPEGGVCFGGICHHKDFCQETDGVAGKEGYNDPFRKDSLIPGKGKDPIFDQCVCFSFTDGSGNPNYISDPGRCDSFTHVREFSCFSNPIVIECANGCRDGACASDIPEIYGDLCSDLDDEDGEIMIILKKQFLFFEKEERIDCRDEGKHCVQRFSLARCMNIPKSVKETVNSLTRSPVVEVRQKAAHDLGDVGDVRAVKPLLDSIRGPFEIDKTVKINAINALGDIGDERAINSLILVLKEVQDSELAGEAARSMARSVLWNEEFGRELVIKPLLRTFDDAPSELKARIIYALGNMEDPSVVQSLYKIFSEDISGDIAGPIASILLKKFIDHPLVKDADNLMSLLSYASDLDPIYTFEVMLNIPLFAEIYNHPSINTLPIYEANSVSLATFRLMLKASYSLDETVSLVLDKRGNFRNKVLLGPDTTMVHFTHEEEFFNNQEMETFARKRGVRRVLDSNLKGTISKDKIRLLIQSSIGETVIWFNGHGGRVNLGLAKPRETVESQEEISPDVILYSELGDDLAARGKLDEVTIVLDSCFSYNFAENLLGYLSRERNVDTFPTIITETNKDRYGYSNVFLESLKELDLDKGEPLLGEHIYKAEQSASAIQDSAVFFSEDRNEPLEIAENTPYHGCPVCVGGTCPISYG